MNKNWHHGITKTPLKMHTNCTSDTIIMYVGATYTHACVPTILEGPGT